MEGRLHKADFCMILQARSVLKPAGEGHHVPAFHAFLKPPSLFPPDLYISHCAFLACQDFHQEGLILSTYFQ